MKFIAFAAGLAVSVVAALATPAKAQSPIDPATVPCTSCHNETTLIVSKEAQFHRSAHATGDAYERGVSKDCAGCHGSEASSARIEAGLMPHDPSIAGVATVSPFTCRTCHDIHTSYTLKDFSITGDAKPVELELTGTIFDGGQGNLCANCHQVRNALPEANDGMVEVTSTRFGPHHGVEAEMILGEGAMGGLRSRPGVHMKKVDDTCVDCHMGPIGDKDPANPLPALARNHTFEPKVAYCTECHDDLKSFDYEDVQSQVKTLLAEVQPMLVKAGIMDAREGMENRSVEGTYPEDVAKAMWNYMLVVEDGSVGVHHPDWALRLLEDARDTLAGR